MSRSAGPELEPVPGDVARSRGPSSAAIVASRILLLVLATGAVITAFVISHERGRESVNADVIFVCPMHPEIRTSVPDRECPICRMALEAIDSSRRDAELDRAVLPPGAELRSPHSVARARLRVGLRAIRGRAWFEGKQAGAALLYRDDAAVLVPGERAVFDPAAGPQGQAYAAVNVRLTADPPIPWDRTTSLVRFRVDGQAAHSPNQTGRLELDPRIRKEVVIPYAAVLQSSAGPYVLVVAADGRAFTKKPIEIGSMFSGDVSVISGVGAGERVATMTTFSLDAERRLGRSAP